MSETPDQPLLRSPSEQTAINVGAPAQGTRSTRAYKVAGITLLACVLIMGQAAVAYFLLSQKGDIKTLQEQNNDLKEELTKGRSVSMPMRMHIPMQAVPLEMDDTLDEGTSTGSPVPPHVTKCQLEASGFKHVQVPGFRPTCDERGLYKAKQCWQGVCWCVNPATGDMTSDSQCNRAVSAGGMTKLETLADVDA